MEYQILGTKKDIVKIVSSEIIITDAQTALDLMMSAKYETQLSKMIIDKASVIEDFFILSNGIAGEILQKFINYHIKVAIVGDYSKYTSKPLKDFIYESNNGKDIFFTETPDEAVRKLDNV